MIQNQDMPENPMRFQKLSYLGTTTTATATSTTTKYLYFIYTYILTLSIHILYTFVHMLHI